tara:strand:- start:54 stop:518 length:465 start_codon:yes stop_codon:yes gene_type:complete
MSEVILDTITGKSTATTITIGSTPVVSASANSMTIRGEGSAQTSIQQGLGKCWVNFYASGTIGFRDSFNMTSLTDNGTGDYTTTFANDFNNSDYVFLGNSMYENSRSHVHGQSSNTAYAAGSMRGISAYVSGTNGEDTASDGDIVNRAYLGDLA